MNIDRHNYETYFLLYVDNELSAGERDAVERFVVENADLKPELELLMNTALAPEAVVFPSKDILFKSELTADRLQEQLLLQLDNELDASTAAELVNRIPADNELKREWALLQQTKLDKGEKILFKDKRSLYRHENGRVVPIYFRRIAAAVIVIGLLVVALVSRLSDEKGKPGVVHVSQQPALKSQDETTGIAAEKDKPAQHKISVPVTDVPKDNVLRNATDNKVAVLPNEHKNGAVVMNKVQKDRPVHANMVAVSSYHQQSNEVVQHDQQVIPVLDNINNQERNKTIASTVQDNRMPGINEKKQEGTVIAKNSAKAEGRNIVDTELTVTDNDYAKTALMSGSPYENNNSSILFLNGEKVNRTKISGLFRKVKRVLARNTNINTGKNVRIAGFEIATR